MFDAQAWDGKIWANDPRKRKCEIAIYLSGWLLCFYISKCGDRARKRSKKQIWTYIETKYVFHFLILVWGWWFLRSSHNLPFSIDPCNRMVWSILIIFAAIILSVVPVLELKVSNVLCIGLEQLGVSCQKNLRISKYIYIYIYVYRWIDRCT